MENKEIIPEEIKPDETFKPIGQVGPIKERLGARFEELKRKASKTTRQVIATLKKVDASLKNLSARRKKQAGLACIGLLVIVVCLGISVKVYRSSDTYSYNLAENYVRAERYEEGAQVYKALISKNDDLKAKEILAFLYLDKLDNPAMAEPLLKEIADLTSDSKILARLKDIFPIISLSPDSSNKEIHRDLIRVELSTTASQARILYSLVNSDYASDYVEYNGPIELSDGDNTIHVKAISSVGYETEVQSHEYRLDLDDKFVELADPALAEAIKAALNKTGPGEKLRQSDLDKVVSIQILGDALLINKPVEDFSQGGQGDLAYFSGFGDLPKLGGLKELRIANQSLEETGHYISDLDHLERLEITYSNLTDIGFIQSLSNLVHLDLSYNNLSQVDLSGSESLIYFDGTGNQMTEYPKTSAVNSPEVMILKNNPIEDLSALEPAISSLSYLDLSGTRITDVSIFSKANQLKVLKLPSVSQLLNTSVFDDAKDISIVPINISESELATDLLDDYQENLRIK